jgi:putative two-component system response regulator
MDQKAKILIVDDTPDNIHVLMQALKDDYKVVAATNGEKALKMANAEEQPDIILLDVMMPEMDGYEVCKRLKESVVTADIPVIFITALSESSDEEKGLAAGAVDFIVKPINPTLVKMRVQNHLELKKHRDDLESLVAERTRELELTQEVTIESLASLAEYRDPETGGHIRRTQNYMMELALQMRKTGKYDDILTDENIKMIYISAPLHDIGKVGIPDEILLKPGRLTDEEFSKMKEHTLYGHDAIVRAMKKAPEISFLSIAKDIAYTHHEKWDGSGYPAGLKGEEIPLVGRIMAVADVYDALISKRVYKPPFPHAKALDILHKDAGTHFDPAVVEAFEAINEKLRDIAIKYADHPEEVAVLSQGLDDLIKIEKVLLAEDHEINLEVMKSQFEAEGLNVVTAVDGKQALERFKEEEFDMVFTDLNMPEMDGYELTENIRKVNKKIPIVAVTVDCTKMQDLKDRGFNDCLAKPFSQESIKRMIENGSVYYKEETGNKVVKPEKEHVNFETMETMLGGAESAKCMAGSYTNANKSDQEMLSQVVESGDNTAIAKAGHKIKGAAKMVGAEALAELCAELETTAKKGEDVSEIVKKVASEIDAVNNLISERYS